MNYLIIGKTDPTDKINTAGILPFFPPLFTLGASRHDEDQTNTTHPFLISLNDEQLT